jgi:hypothetical protein
MPEASDLARCRRCVAGRARRLDRSLGGGPCPVKALGSGRCEAEHRVGGLLALRTAVPGRRLASYGHGPLRRPDANARVKHRQRAARRARAGCRTSRETSRSRGPIVRLAKRRSHAVRLARKRRRVRAPADRAGLTASARSPRLHACRARLHACMHAGLGSTHAALGCTHAALTGSACSLPAARAPACPWALPWPRTRAHPAGSRADRPDAGGTRPPAPARAPSRGRRSAPR